MRGDRDPSTLAGQFPSGLLADALDNAIQKLRDGVDILKVNEKLTVPVVNDADADVPNPEIGTWVYLTGEGTRPEGMWRYTSDGWKSGAQTNRINFGRGTEGLGNNSNRRIANFTVPAGSTLLVWAAQVSESSGATAGALLQLQNVSDGGTVIYELDAGDGIDIQSGNPLLDEDGGGDEYRVRLRNETGGSTGLTGFMSISVEELPQ